MNTNIELSDIRGFIQRRKTIFAMTFLAVFLLIAARVMTLPPVYRSSATILIEGQQMPQEYVKSTATSYAEERVSLITKQVMSRSRLLEIVKKFDLYRGMREEGVATDEIVETMKGAIQFQTIRSDVIDERTRRASQATIAFSLTYEGDNPVKVQQVTAELASLYLSKDTSTREEHASSATSFFRKEAETLKERVNDLDKRIGAFKKDHIGELPEHGAFTLQTIGRLELEEDRIKSEIRTVKAKIANLKEQISSVDPAGPMFSEQGKPIPNSNGMLKYLRLQLITLQSSVGENHPDMQKLKREIRELESHLGVSVDGEDKMRRLKEIQDQLAQMKGRFAAKHPDVVRLTNEMELLKKGMDEQPTRGLSNRAPDIAADNPAYLSLRAQIVVAETELKGLVDERNSIKQLMTGYQSRLKSAAMVEKEYNMLLRDYESTKTKYSEVMNKLMEAEAAQEIETSQRGERLTIIDPAELPAWPYKPNRKVLLFMGVILSLGMGAGSAVFREMTDHSIKGLSSLRSLTAIPVLSIIPYVENGSDRRRRHARRALGYAAVGIALIAAGIGVHWYVMPLDDLWAKTVVKITALIPLPFAGA